MEAGKKNIIFGWSWLILFLILGFYLFLRAADPSWAGLQRLAWRAAHVHGNVLAFLNILYGLTIDKTNLGSGLKQAGSWLAIIGAILLSGSLLLMPFFMQIALVEMIGGAVIILAVAIMIYGQLFARV